MSTLFSLLETKTAEWVKQELENAQSVPGAVIKYVRKTGKLREPQAKAIEVYLWLKFVGQNQKLSDMVKQGLLYDDANARDYKGYHAFGQNYTTQFLNQFSQDNNLKKLQDMLLDHPLGSSELNWDSVLAELLHNYEYPNFLFSLPMGAGKTFLMAAFIYLDLYFAKLLPKDKRFAHNFVVFAPQASKTAILPSLQTIKNFNPEWILPPHDAAKLKQEIQIEILDSLSSQRKDKLQGNNPNLEKVNRITQTKNFGLVFITNAEKVVLEQYADKDKMYTTPGTLYYDPKIVAGFQKLNELREKLSQVPYLTVILDEVHHSYGENGNGEKKLRQAVNILNQHGHVVCVLGLSGTPYVKHKVQIGNDEISLNQIQDIVYNFPLNEGIGRFLKIPEIKSVNVKEELFIAQAMDEFFNEFDFTYPNGTKSKLAFYCPSKAVLNEKILPAVQKWYAKHRPGKEDEIFRFYRAEKKDDKEFKLPKDSEAIFNNLDKPYSKKRIVLLVAIGTEGWDCRSLAGVVLPRQKTTKNFVLQTTCRCLREVEDASKEKALIYLERENYLTLDHELKENYHLNISDLKAGQDRVLPVTIRKPKLGKLQYKQIITKYQIVTIIKADTKDAFKDFDFDGFKQRYAYNAGTITGKIGKAGLVGEVAKQQYVVQEFSLDFSDFIYSLANSTFGRFSEVELLEKYDKNLQNVFQQLIDNRVWLAGHPNPDILSLLINELAAALADEITYNRQELAQDVSIELLEWQTPNPVLSIVGESGQTGKFMPNVQREDVKLYQKHPEDLTEIAEQLDSQNISFNYLPYKMDSEFEQNALKQMLKMAELSELEVYYNGYKDKELDNFYIQTPRGVYTPDFLLLKRKSGKKYKSAKDKGEIDKVLIVETKGEPYYDQDFRHKENFVKDVFIKHNPNFSYKLFKDAGGNDFSKHLTEFLDIIKTF